MNEFRVGAGREAGTLLRFACPHQDGREHSGAAKARPLLGGDGKCGRSGGSPGPCHPPDSPSHLQGDSDDTDLPVESAGGSTDETEQRFKAARSPFPHYREGDVKAGGE